LFAAQQHAELKKKRKPETETEDKQELADLK
jgi:hypothetical protein